MLGEIVAETDRYTHKNIPMKEPGTSKHKPWSDTDWEMYLFLAYKRVLVPQIPSHTHQSLVTPCHVTYLLLMRYLHFCLNELQPTRDRLYKIQMVI
ncbi:hypothetical protein PR048_021547 [Dryococelus australis]|uniref:Uncharacterized protein n=1 Tax=Dryococelus australis TaxID=614101 RepID=A0ABQ9GYI1_9NEOP|nr:hypothetical protein PR048_021547 [Dryococelus australis]